MPARIARSVCAMALGSSAALGGDCLPDLNGSGDVTAVDLVELLGQWGSCPFAPCTADINNDGAVDILDTVLLLDCWGPCPCSPPGVTERFDQIHIEFIPDGSAPGSSKFHLFATGADVQIGDVLLAAALAEIHTVGLDVFVQHPKGGNTPPIGALCGVDPTICDDTFFTMNLLTDDAAKVLAAPDVSMDDKDLTGSWFVLPTESEREAVDIGALTGNPGQAGVLIAQLNVSKASPPSCEGSGFEGVVTLFTSSADGGSLEGIEVPFSRVVVVSCVWDCIGDDLVIGLDEFLAVLGLWGFVGSHACDFDGDGFIGIDEFLKVLGLWGLVCCQ